MPRSRSPACSQASYTVIESIRQIPDQYKVCTLPYPHCALISNMPVMTDDPRHLVQAVLLDQFGVLHDGQKPYPGSIEAVKALAESGRKILIISNSSRSAPPSPL